MFPSESAPCNNKLAESLVNDLETSSAIGDVQVEDYIYGNDFSPILVPKSAFQGNNFMFYVPKKFISVNLIIPGARYLSDYRKMWDKQTLKITDDFYSILRTLYR